jgi:rod shape-determining protein MreD
MWVKNAAFVAIAVGLLLVQGNLFRITGLITGFFDVQNTTPSLVLPLVVFLGVHEPSMARGALLSFAIGYTTDLFASAPIGLFTFTSMTVWWLARVAGVRLSAQTLPTQVFLGFVFSIFEAAIILMLLAIFGLDPQRPVELVRTWFPHAVVTALCSPLVFRLAHRLQQSGTPTVRTSEGGSQ